MTAVIKARSPMIGDISIKGRCLRLDTSNNKLMVYDRPGIGRERVICVYDNNLVSLAYITSEDIEGAIE